MHMADDTADDAYDTGGYESVFKTCQVQKVANSGSRDQMERLVKGYTVTL